MINIIKKTIIDIVILFCKNYICLPQEIIMFELSKIIMNDKISLNYIKKYYKNIIKVQYSSPI